MKTYNKLVRDNIPNIIENDGKTAVFRVLEEKEFIEELNKKLLEEVNEFLESGDFEELVDIGEVIHAILENKNITIKEYQDRRVSKKNERGAFSKRYFLEKVI